MCATGSGVWAANEVFGGADGSLKEVVCVEPAPFMRELGERFCSSLQSSTKWLHTLGGGLQRQFPVVVAAFVLREIPESQRRQVR